MTMNGFTQRWRRGGVVLAVALLTACIQPTARPQPVTAPCADSSYVKLQQQDPDSLSAREWQRLQYLDHECTPARAQARRGANGVMGTGHGGSHWMGVGIGTIIMVAMMIGMW